MTRPLELSRGQIETHWRTLQRAFRQIPVPSANTFKISENWVGDLGFAGLTSSRTEWVNRERGGRVGAVPLFETPPVYWLSWRETWEFAGKSRWRFRESGVTVFEGETGIAAKSQLFRAEWAGLALRSGGVVDWQAPGAAHPHWQFDALAEFVAEASNRKLATQIAEELAGGEVSLEEFGDATAMDPLASKRSPTWARMHFASAAKWHEIPWTGNTADVAAHALSPASSAEIQRWLIAIICYVKSELTRHHATGS